MEEYNLQHGTDIQGEGSDMRLPANEPQSAKANTSSSSNAVNSVPTTKTEGVGRSIESTSDSDSEEERERKRRKKEKKELKKKQLAFMSLSQSSNEPPSPVIMQQQVPTKAVSNEVKKRKVMTHTYIHA
jgi:7-keto-8-aminopelargonate synthetase-like enzyme